MSMQQYTTTSHPVSALLNWIETEEVALPELQRPFVWKATKVRNLLDSLYQGYPIGYLISWRNPTVALKDGTPSAGKRILIDGQQRIIALKAALLGEEVLTKDYKTVRIRIAFNPLKEIFEVRNPAIARDASWIDDVSKIFGPDADPYELREDYSQRNPQAEQKAIDKALGRVGRITNNHVGFIELAEDLDIETANKIFVRINSAGIVLSQADFVMSKIAANEKFGGSLMRKAIDYFCHVNEAPEQLAVIERRDRKFAESQFLPKMRWLKNASDRLYKPTYTDMLRVASVSELGRGKLQDLAALLSGRNFETRENEEAIAEEYFSKLEKGILDFINETHFNRFTAILRSSGFLTQKLLRGNVAINAAYILYLQGRSKGVPANDIERMVRRWYAMSILTVRYSGSIETLLDSEISQIKPIQAAEGLQRYVDEVIANELPDTFWSGLLLQGLRTSSAQSPYFVAYQAAQAVLGDKGFLSTNISVRDLLLGQGDKHHVYPRGYLKKRGLRQSAYNQIANLVISQDEINKEIADTPPEIYFTELVEQVNGDGRYYGGIQSREALRQNFTENCLPASLLQGEVPDYEAFLEERRHLMADKIRKWFNVLSR